MIVVVLGTVAAIAGWPKPLRGFEIMRQRAALIICVGAAIFAFSTLVLEPHWLPAGLLRDAVRYGWLAMYGAALTLIGVYYWIGQGARPE